MFNKVVDFSPVILHTTRPEEKKNIKFFFFLTSEPFSLNIGIANME